MNSNENKGEKELESLFDLNENKLNKTLVKTRIKSIIINIGISLLILAIIAVGFSQWRYYRLQNMRNNIISSVEENFNLLYPNRYLGNFTNNEDFLSGSIKAGTYKILENRVVYAGNIEKTYGINGIGNVSVYSSVQRDWKSGSEKGVSIWIPRLISQNTNNVDFYNELGQRKMLFFYPFIDYEDLYRNETDLLDEIDNKRVAEMSLSFDKYYTLDEAEELLKGFNVTWYWIDSLDKEAKNNMMNAKSIDELDKDSIARVVTSEEDDSTIGIRLYNSQGQKIDKPVEQFCWNLYNVSNSIHYDGLKVMLDIKVGTGKEASIRWDGSKLRIGGAVVTGTVEELKALKGKPFIKASTIGVVADRY